MPDLVLRSDLLSPEPEKILEFTGNHPSRLLKEMPDLIRETFRIEGTKIFEDQIKWDRSVEPIEFYGIWRGKDKKDARSTVWVKITIQGEQSTKDSTGHAKVRLTGWLQTKIPFTTQLHKFITLVNLRFFYNEQKRKYIEEGMIRIGRLEDEIRSLFELMRKE